MITKKFPGLPDHIRPGVQILFVGINPGLRSAEVGHHYAGHSNRFWKVLYESKCVPQPLTYQDDWRLPDWGYGLTNIINRPTAGTKELTPLDYSKGRATLRRTILRYRPKIIALLGITMKTTLFPAMGRTRSGKKHQGPESTVGLQHECFGETPVFVLPNPSGRNAHYSYHDMVTLFRQLRDLNQNLSRRIILPDEV